MNNKYLYIIIGILAVLLAFFAIKSYIQVPYQIPDVVIDDQQTNQNSQTPPETESNFQTKTAFGISVTAPKTLTISSGVGDYGVFQGISNIKISNGNHIVVDINKYPSQVRFNEDIPQGQYSDWILLNNNYPIGGTTGIDYKRKDTGGFLIVVPSKLTLIFIEPISFSGVSQAVLDKIMDSVIFIQTPPPTYSTILPQYVSGQEGWPPAIQTSSEAYSCEAGHSEMLDVTEKIINNKNYCITTSVDAGAGQRYGQYKYTRANGMGTKTTYFTLRWPSCGVYGGPGDAQYNQCQSNQNTFFANLDLLIDSLM